MRIGIEAIVDLFADEIEAKCDEGDTKARGSVPELIGEHGMLPPRIPSSEELCRVFSRSHFLFQFDSLALSLPFLSFHPYWALLNPGPDPDPDPDPLFFFLIHFYGHFFPHPYDGAAPTTQICSKRNAKPSLISCSAQSQPQPLQEQTVESGADVVRERSVSVVLLAGGQGKRMGAIIPKQYLPLFGQPIALFSFHTFFHMFEVKEVVVVCDPSYRDVFEDAKGNYEAELKFALPGKERQDSVYNGLQECAAVDPSSELVCIHDSARPLVLSSDVRKVLTDGLLNGAAVLGVPVKATIKEANSESFVVKTLDRKTLWEMQTPQVIKPELLRKGFELVNREGLEVTDDVSIVEHLKHPVYITEGSYTNIKVTTPDDMLLAERILNIDSEESIVLPIHL
ncbi:hypothetical protein V8G54_015072 [Vigna mungo]|uniref:2-C-methyl-D-erythritol 4-phosphate cytidylyltransferase, chloroplastic n=1 Tax=Vigna mungo TaxID=3915 RepID=A0AAQ3NJK2_VIGMU